MGEGNEQKVSGKKIRSHGAGLAMRVSCVSIAINVVLSVFKVGAGILAHSGAMISDGVHSASDVFSTLIVMAGITMASRKSDKEHPYGHERMECVAALLLSAVLFATGIAIGVSAVETIGSGPEGSRNVPGMLALGAAVISIVVKEWMFWYTRAAARKLKSGALMADAWHHRSDALSSVGTLVGIGCAYFLGGGWRLADPAAAIVVALLILRVAWQLMKMGMDELLEKSLPREQEEHILTLIAADPAVASPHNLRTRRIGQNIAVEVHIRVDGAMTVTESHRLTVDIERRLRDAYGEGTIVSIHVEPRKQPPVNESK